MRTKNYKTEIEKLSDDYEAAKEEAFDTQFKEMFKKHFGTKLGMHVSVTSDDVQGFLDTFEFAEEFEWCADIYQSRLDDYDDQKYDVARDARYGL